MRLTHALLGGILIVFAVQLQAADEEVEAELKAAWAEYQKFHDEENWDAAVDAAAHLFDLAEFGLPPDDDRMIVLAINYANLLSQENYKTEAAKVLAKARKENAPHFGPDSEQLLNLIVAEGDLAARPFDSKLQKRKYKEALEIPARVSGRDSLEYAKWSLLLGARILETSRTDDGARLIDDALEIYEEKLGADAFLTGQANFYAGKLAYAKSKKMSAEKYFLESLKGFDPSLEDGRVWNMLARKFLVATYETRGKSEKSSPHLIAIARLQEDVEAGPSPIFRSGPNYPSSMLRQGKEGYVDFEFTVDEEGFVRTPVVTYLAGDDAFVKPATEAILKFRYAPMMVDGEVVASERVKARITFAMR